MKIIVLDGYPLNPGDLSWKLLEELGEVIVFDRTSPGQIVQRAAGAEVVLTNKVPLDGDTLKQLPDLKYIGVMATGFNIIDLRTASEQGITVTNVPTYSTRSVAQFTFALILELCHRVQYHSDSAKGGRWAAADDFSYWDFPLIELAGKTFGIIGFGTIGRNAGELALAFGMKVLASSRSRKGGLESAGCSWADTDEIFRQADIVSLHCPLTPETAGLVNRKRLASMKQHALLINTSRGPLVVEEDLAEALNTGIISGAGLDVLAEEPPHADNPLLQAKNCLVTPHMAWATYEARSRLIGTVAQNIRRFMEGAPENVVKI